MLTITESAWERLSQFQTTRPDITLLRLKYEDGQVKCCRGVRKKRDQVFTQPGRPTLLVTTTVAENLADQALEAPETDRGRRLRLKRLSR